MKMRKELEDVEDYWAFSIRVYVLTNAEKVSVGQWVKY
jgi:hypothetical protein